MRRLPPWMLGGASTGETAPRKRSEPKAPEKKTEKRPRRSQKPKEKDLNIHSEEEPKRVRRKIGEEAKRSNINQSLTTPEDENLTIDDLLSFAQEYVDKDDDQTRKKSETLSVSESIVLDESTNLTTSSSQGGTRDPTSDDMLGLLLGPFFKKH